MNNEQRVELVKLAKLISSNQTKREKLLSQAVKLGEEIASYQSRIANLVGIPFQTMKACGIPNGEPKASDTLSNRIRAMFSDGRSYTLKQIASAQLVSYQVASATVNSLTIRGELKREARGVYKRASES